MIPRVLALLCSFLLLPCSFSLAAGSPSDAEMIQLFKRHKAEFEKLRAYLIKTNTKIFGPGYRDYAALKAELGIKKFYVTDRGQAAFRFPVYLHPPMTQYFDGYTKGYAWLPLTKNFPHYPGEIYMVDPSEPRTNWIFAPGGLDKVKVPSGGYNVVLHRIEGDWYIYADNNPYRRSW